MREACQRCWSSDPGRGVIVTGGSGSLQGTAFGGGDRVASVELLTRRVKHSAAGCLVRSATERCQYLPRPRDRRAPFSALSVQRSARSA
jgi:hypothetical protein